VPSTLLYSTTEAHGPSPILVKVWTSQHRLDSRITEGSSYEEARDDPLRPTQEARERQRAIKALERLGDVVTVEHAA
jgi:hypothetical protein